MEIQKPEWKTSYLIPFTRGRRDYIKDRKVYDFSLLNDIQKLRKKQLDSINLLSFILISLIITLWSTLPQTIILPNWLKFTKLGMQNVDWKNNWGNAIWLTIVPSIGGFGLHHLPNKTPPRIKFILNLIIKIIPIIILIIIWYLPNIEKEIRKLKKIEKVE